MARKQRPLPSAFFRRSIADGGPGSGNFGHKGRPGQRGGSGPGGGGSARSYEITGEEPGSESSLEDLFADLWNEDPDKKTDPDEFDPFAELTKGTRQTEEEAEAERKKAEAETKEREAFGSNKLLESEYPSDLRLTPKEQKRLQDDIADYFSEGRRGKKTDTRLMSGIYYAAVGRTPLVSIERERQKAKRDLAEADEMIAQRAAEGYKGMSREESYRRYQQLKSALRGADETEIGEILASFRVGERGIRAWQTQRKEAKETLVDLDFIEKLMKRAEYAKKKTSGLDSKPSRKLMRLR